ncbi:hypothetical protein [Pseudomonas sp. F01002]|uniref:hypothetical protein n=1 Tax=Pseudomonas sp. F01002 TaxID=2555724 RepID=UPI00106DA8D1|nr:hypothetical protein [Pseudomonas sp. F01002]TFB39016.1 hypothetical protein E3W21_17695 [Pseudomonas sp. F01002]
MEQIAAIVGAVVALSVASERLVEIIKGFIPFLNTASENPEREARRRSYLQILAVLSGVVTALVSKDIVPTLVIQQSGFLGLFSFRFVGQWRLRLLELYTYLYNPSERHKKNRGRQG